MRFLWVFFALLSSCLPLLAQQKLELGKPFIRNHPPKEYNAGAYMFDVAQNANGLMVFANSWNVQTYDAVGWDYIQMSNFTSAYAVEADSSGKVYVGGIDEIGYLRPNVHGALIYESLRPYLKGKIDRFGRIFNLIVHESGVYFMAAQAVIRWNGSNCDVWHFKQQLWFVGAKGENIFAQTEAAGIFRLLPKGGVEEVFADHPVLKEDPIVATLPMSSGSYWVVFANKGIYEMADGQFRQMSLEINAFLQKNHATHAIKLASGMLAFGTQNAGIAVSDATGRVMGYVDQSVGLQDNTVEQLFEDKDHALWVALNNGAARVEISTPITSWNPDSGLLGEVRAVERLNGVLLATTSQGLFALAEEREGHARFMRVPGSPEQCGALVKMTLAGQDLLLMTSKEGLYEIRKIAGKPLQMKLLANSMANATPHPSFIDQERIYLASSASIGVAHWENGTWTYEGKIKGIASPRFFSMTEDSEGNIWMIDPDSGAVSFSPTKENAEWVAKDYRFYGLDKGIPDKNFLGFDVVGGRAYLTSEKGVFAFKKEKDRFEIAKDELGPQLGDYFTGFYYFEEDIKGNLWYVAYQNGDELWREIAYRQPDGTFVIDSLSLRRVPVMDGSQYGTFAEDDGVVWFGGTDGLFRFDSRVKINDTHKFKAFVRKVVTQDEQIIFSGNHYALAGTDTVLSEEQTSILRLPYTQNSLIFHFSCNNYAEESENLFSYWLEGSEGETWSEWTKETKQHLRNLPEGSYRMHVKAKGIYGVESAEAIYAFEIAPPWYRTKGAYTGYVLAFIGTIWLFAYLNTVRLRKINESLEKQVVQRTAEINAKKEEITAQAESLKHANEEILAKNDLLVSQQEELLAKSEEINRQNEVLANTNKHITDSINYASRIQKAILGDAENIVSHFSDAFVWLRPRDIVSGDFYWFSEVQIPDVGRSLIVIAADCTGHGVPGAFMTVMGSALLNELVSDSKIYEPAAILHELDKKVVAATNRQQQGGQVNDGMDMCIVRFDMDARRVLFAGAKNPLYMVRNGEISSFRGSKFPIGSSQFSMEKVFEQEAFDMQPGDRFYLSSDGYQDQFGGESNSKFLRKRFRELLLEISELPMAQQQSRLEQAFLSWKGKCSQTDDVLVIGVAV